MLLCVLIAGLCQLLFAALGAARIMKFTPYPVLAGFLNGVALLIIVTQLKVLLGLSDVQTATSLVAERGPSLVLAVLVALVVIWFGASTRRFPALLAGLLFGICAFYAARAFAPGLELGGTVGALVFTLPNASLVGITSLTTHEAWPSILAEVLPVAVALAVVATLESLLTFRVAENLSDVPVRQHRDVVAQGIANCASALCGGIALAASPSQTTAAFHAGGRARFVAATAVALILAAGGAMPDLLGAIPTAVLSGLLLAIGVQLFDRWSCRLLLDALVTAPSHQRQRARYDALVVLAVMLVTAAVSVVAAIVVGFALACGIFIVNMSRPIIRRRYNGLTSKRVRSAHDAAMLRASGSRRVVLELQGALLFGNADDLAQTVRELFADADIVVLDLRGIAEIDVSGATILNNLLDRSKSRGKNLLFCNVPLAQARTVESMTRAHRPVVFPDLESTLEWMEEEVLGRQTGKRLRPHMLSLEEHDIARGLTEQERAVLVRYLIRREFRAGSALTTEGEHVSSLFLLMDGSVSVHLSVPDARERRRIASLAAGTLIGSVSLLELAGTRLVSMFADEDVVSYELARPEFEDILNDQSGTRSKAPHQHRTRTGASPARNLRRLSRDDKLMPFRRTLQWHGSASEMTANGHDPAVFGSAAIWSVIGWTCSVLGASI